MATLHDLHERVIDALGGGLIARDDLDLAPFQAGGDLETLECDTPALGDAQRLGDLRLGDAEQPQRPLPVLGGPPQRVAQRRRLRPPASTSAAARAAGRAARRRSGPAGLSSVLAGGTTSPGAVPTGSSTRRAPRGPSPACGCLPPSPPGRGSASARPAAPRSRRSGPRAPRRARSPALGTRLQPPRSGHRQSARARRWSQRHRGPAVGHECSARSMSCRAVPHDRHIGKVNTELAQTLGQPRPVAVAAPGR